MRELSTYLTPKGDQQWVLPKVEAQPFFLRWSEHKFWGGGDIAVVALGGELGRASSAVDLVSCGRKKFDRNDDSGALCRLLFAEKRRDFRGRGERRSDVVALAALAEALAFLC